jgi:putative addiction module killer protein
MAVNTIYYYQAADGRRPFVEWLEALADRQARARIEARLARVASGNLGDVEPVGDGVAELRIDWGPGYRVYFAQDRSKDCLAPVRRGQEDATEGHQSCEEALRRL